MITLSKDLLNLAAKKRQELLVGVTKSGDIRIGLAKADQSKVERLMKADNIKISK